MPLQNCSMGSAIWISPATRPGKGTLTCSWNHLSWNSGLSSQRRIRRDGACGAYPMYVWYRIWGILNLFTYKRGCVRIWCDIRIRASWIVCSLPYIPNLHRKITKWWWPPTNEKMFQKLGRIYAANDAGFPEKNTIILWDIVRTGCGWSWCPWVERAPTRPMKIRCQPRAQTDEVIRIRTRLTLLLEFIKRHRLVQRRHHRHHHTWYQRQGYMQPWCMLAVKDQVLWRICMYWSVDRTGDRRWIDGDSSACGEIGERLCACEFGWLRELELLKLMLRSRPKCRRRGFDTLFSDVEVYILDGAPSIA